MVCQGYKLELTCINSKFPRTDDIPATSMSARGPLYGCGGGAFMTLMHDFVPHPAAAGR